MSIANKHIADNNFVFQQDSALAHLAHNIVQTSQLHFSDLWSQQPICDWWTSL